MFNNIYFIKIIQNLLIKSNNDLYNIQILIKYICIELKYKHVNVENEDLFYYMTKYNNQIIQNSYIKYYLYN
jgi:hypothetical protein